MEIETSKQFDKMVFRIKDTTVKQRLRKVMEQVMEAETINDIPNLTAIVGHTGYFRIKFGDYRVGISLEDKTVWFLFFAKRDESTYKKFP